MDSFLHNIGPNKTLERGMRMKVVEGEPDFGKPSRAPKKFDGERKSFDKKPRDENKPAKPRDRAAADFNDERPRKKFGNKPEFAGERNFSERPGKDWSKPAKPGFDRTGEGKPKKKKAKSNAR
jgi:ATP-dependent RNA helicase DeaD